VLSWLREINWDTWMSNWKAIYDYNLYGDPTISLFGEDPRPNDIVMLLDGSGSMLNEGKWNAAKDGAVLFYQLMEAFSNPDFKDRYGSVVFRWPCSGLSDMTGVVHPLAEVGDGTPVTVSDFDSYLPLSDYCTPIGTGLETAIDQLNLITDPNVYSDRSIILLSDGKHNQGISPTSVTVPDNVRVFAVGLGEDNIDPQVIESIADYTNGDFRISPSPLEMEDFFCQILCNTSAKLQNVPVEYNWATIDQDCAVFICVWDNPAKQIKFSLRPLGSENWITPQDLGAAYPALDVTYHAAQPGETHAFYVIKNIPNSMMGKWEFIGVMDQNNILIDIHSVLLKVIEDPFVIADFEVENIDHFTGQPIVLRAHITENGRPLTGLTEVYADLARSPENATGNLMATYEPPPSYPPMPSPGSDITTMEHYLMGVMQAAGISSLSVSDGMRVVLRDDGIGGDLHADDGIYSGVFTNTHLEGSYTFVFRAKGTNASGNEFDRSETLSEFVELGLNPSQSSVSVTSSVVDQQTKTVTSMITVVPRDSFGSYLGPFRGEVIDLWSSGGTLQREADGSLKFEDHRDGSYTFTLKYPLGTDGSVSVSVGDVIITDRMVVESPPQKYFSLAVGAAFPLAEFSESYRIGLSVQGDFERPLISEYLLRVVLGYNNFFAAEDTIDNTYIVNFNAYLKRSLTAGGINTFAELGPGYYLREGSGSKAGVSAGGGITFAVSNRFTLGIMSHYHMIMSNPRTQYVDITGGIALGF
jgi:hypothetical protein